MMKNLLTLAAMAALSLAAGTAMAGAGNSIVFGSRNAGLGVAASVPYGQPVTVSGPLLQVRLPDGADFAFQQGAVFELLEGADGSTVVKLTGGNLRATGGTAQVVVVGEGGSRLTIPAGSSCGMTAMDGIISGRVFVGSMEASAGGRTRTFNAGGNGFTVSEDGVEGTFTPLAALSPAYLAEIEPAGGGDAGFAPVTPPQGNSLQQGMGGDVPTDQLALVHPPVEVAGEPVISENTVELPAESPVVPDPAVTEPEPEETTPVETAPVEQEPVVPEPVEPTVPVASLPYDLSGKEAVYTPNQPGFAAPNSYSGGATPKAFTFTDSADGHKQLETMRSSAYGMFNTELGRGTAEHADNYSVGNVAGIGRWVGGAVEVTSQGVSLGSPNYGGGTGTNNLHYVWGTPADGARSGEVTYNLKAHTTPTYYGTAAPTAVSSADYDATLKINFFGGMGVPNGSIAGTVTMNHADGGVAKYDFASTAPARINASGAIAAAATSVGSVDSINCGGGCTMTNILDFYGTNSAYVGNAYSLQQNSTAGINGAALFEAAP